MKMKQGFFPEEYSMNVRAYLVWCVAVFLVFAAGCQQNPTEPTATKTSTISGTVLDAGNNPLALSRVIDIGSLAQVDTTKSDGSFILKLQLSSNYNTSLYAIKPGYGSDTPKVSLTPGDNISGINIHMFVTDSSKIVSGKSGRPASIGLVSQTATSILLKGGTNPSCTLTFLVVDSLNRPVTGTNACKVKFSMSVARPSGESIKPDTAGTDPLTGQVSTTVFSGTQPNAILVTAQVIDPTHKITATAGLTEGTGLPDGNHVSISASVFNIAGRVYDGLSTTIMMTVNDQFGNPVADGTPVSFVTNGGGIAKDAFTQNGVASAKLTSGGGNPPPGGLVTVTAEVKGDTSVRKSDSSIVRTIQVLFSGHTTVIRSANTVNFEVPFSDMNYFDFTVSDDNGKPLSGGSTIDVSVDAANDALKSSLTLKGNSITMPDTKDTNATHFRVWVIDKLNDSLSGVLNFKIKIVSQNGNYPAVDQYWFSGYKRGATPGLGYYGVPAGISLADSSSKKLYLLETQLPDTSTRISFVVRDGSGYPLSVTNKAVVSFSLLQAPYGTTLSPTVDSTGQSGIVSVNVVAGNTPGTALVVARTSDGAGHFYSALSMPIEIAHGLPDSNQIFMNLPKNMFNDMGNLVGSLKVNLADVNGNFPAPQYIRFSTSGGVISPISALIDANGSASTGLYGGKVPKDPILGFGNVSVFVKVHGGVNATRKVPFVFSGEPVITILNIRETDTVVIPNTGYKDISFKVADAYGIPLSKGNTIVVSQSGVASNGISISNANNTTAGLIDTTTTIYMVRILNDVSKRNISGTFDVTITVNGPNGTAVKKLNGILGAPPSGYSSSIQLLAGYPSNTTISVKGTGASETSTMKFVVKDSLGNFISSTHPATVNFSILNGPGGGEFLSPTSAVTDDSGKVSTTISAGTKSGVVQVIASTTVNSVTITSTPVTMTIASGLADSSHFTAWLTDKSASAPLVNFPGNVLQGDRIGEVRVSVGDRYGNPVQPGTALYFTTNAGLVTSSGYTVDNGHLASTPPVVSLFGGNPIPPNGQGVVTVSTLGQRVDQFGVVQVGVKVTKDIPFVYSLAPVITASNNIGTIGTGNSLEVNYKVADVNNNPLAFENFITVTASTPPNSQLNLDYLGLKGDLNIKMPDTKDTNLTNYKFTIINKLPAGGTGGGFIITIGSTGPNGTTTRTITGSLQASTSSAPTQLALSSLSSGLIAAKGTGGLNTSDVTFQALDAGGRPVDITQSDTVYFSISDTTGGSYCIPTFALTDGTGKASTTLYAGLKYGTPTITARLKSIISQPVPVRISGPSWTNFNVTISANNLPGLSQIGSSVGTLNVQLGDTLGNPVLAGTIVRFSTSGGMVDALATTASGGSASVRLSGGATPNEPALGGIGWGYVTAQTQGNNGTVLQKPIPFLFSGAPVITTLSVPASDTITVYDAGFVDVSYRIADINGNPLAAGNAVTVSVTGSSAGEISLSNYYNFTTNGTTDKSQTTYVVRVFDNKPNAGSGGNFDVTIAVTGPNGTTTRRFHGVLVAPGAIIPPSADIKKAAQIAYIGVSANDIYISGVGALENAVITYEVRDSLGTPVAATPRYGATFSINFFPNVRIGGGTYPRVIPAADSTDTQGKLHASIVSGTQAGVVEIVAQIILPSGGIISSSPVKISVHSGFPDQNHFTLMPSRFVFPGIDYLLTPYPTFKVAVGDTFSNPVAKGTAIYFHTQAGIIETGFNDFTAYTDKDGLASVGLLTVNPRPNVLPYYDPSVVAGRVGAHWIWAQTQSQNGKSIVDSVFVIWNAGPIKITGLPAGITMNNHSVSPGVAMTVTDANDNPLCDGTTISAAINVPSGLTDVKFDLTGSFTTSMPAVIPNAAYARFPGNGITNFTFSVVDLSTGVTAGITVTLVLTINAPGLEQRTFSIPVTVN
jgi:hypothetical protein